jgi:feruloyl esterase
MQDDAIRQRPKLFGSQGGKYRRNKLFFWCGALTTAIATSGCGGGTVTSVSHSDSSNLANSLTANAKSKCTSMLGQSIEGAVISETTFLPASGNIPEHCQLVGKMPQELNFKMKLPTQWNDGTVFIGGGGFDGHIDGIPQSPSILERGYSTISTNFGHESDTPFGSGSFALDNQMLNEYADLAVPRVLGSAKAVMRSFYGEQKTANSKMVYDMPLP